MEMSEVIHKLEVELNALRGAAQNNDSESFWAYLEDLEGVIKDMIDENLSS